MLFLLMSVLENPLVVVCMPVSIAAKCAMLKDRDFYGKKPRGAPNVRLVGEGGRGGVEMVGEECEVGWGWVVKGGRWRGPVGVWSGTRMKVGEDMKSVTARNVRGGGGPMRERKKKVEQNEKVDKRTECWSGVRTRYVPIARRVG